MNENVLPTDLTNNIINAARSFEISLAILNNFFSALDINDFFFFFSNEFAGQSKAFIGSQRNFEANIS